MQMELPGIERFAQVALQFPTVDDAAILKRCGPRSYLCIAGFGGAERGNCLRPAGMLDCRGRRSLARSGSPAILIASLRRYGRGVGAVAAGTRTVRHR